MSNNHHDVNLANIASIIICSLFVVNMTYAQPTQTNNSYPHPNTPNPTTSSLPENPPDLNRLPRSIHRTGTAIGARNSISIKSTDAGIIHRQPTASGCINCGVIDFINKVSQGGGLNAIANGVVTGTVAREIARYAHYPHDTNYHPIMPGGAQNHDGGYITQPSNQYNIGVTMKDGSQAIITLPDAANFHQGDKVKLIDGMLVPDR